jgi:hypothetical protein
VLWTFDRLAPVLNAVGMAAAEDKPLDVDRLARDLDERPVHLKHLLVELDERLGLIELAPEDESDAPSLLTRAGSQYLSRKGQVPDEVLEFLPGVVDDLQARQALLVAGTVLVDEFHHQVAQGNAASHAGDLVPVAFAGAVDDQLAVNLFAAAVALLARLSCGRPAGCLAEEIMAVALIEQATFWLEGEAEDGDLSEEDLALAQESLRGIFELFEDDDVLDLFDMEEPADAAVAGHSLINRQAGVVDQRLEAWFRPFGGVPGTGHLVARTSDRAEP